LSSCKICSHSPASFRAKKRQVLCDYCDEGTPTKVSRQEFDEKFWMDPTQVPTSVRKNFYSDYLGSGSDLGGYIVCTSLVSSGTMVSLRGPITDTEEMCILLKDMLPHEDQAPVLLDGKLATILRQEIGNVYWQLDHRHKVG
jgi:hypothetical protein